MVRLFKKSDFLQIERNHIFYDIDLSEGIDFSLYLLGNFQKHVIDLKEINLGNRPVIFDVGANIGHMTLEYAKNVSGSKVYAFEPTDYAFQKLQKNLSLNPELSKRIKATKAIVSSEKAAPLELKFYSSWKLNNKSKDRHHIHGGLAQGTSQVEVISLDSFVIENHISQVDLIKIDTDGSELSVLNGARKTLSTSRPLVIFEIGLYLLEERGLSYSDYADFFESINYKIQSAHTEEIITPGNFKKLIPRFGTTDLLAVPK